MWKIQLFKLNFNEEEIKAVNETVESGWITMGQKSREFEDKFSNLLGDNIYSVALSSGTASLHTALLSLGIGAGDEVIIPALTFVADINVVNMVGATPVLADCGSYKNWNVTADTIRVHITSKTKAIIVVHFAGYPCEMDKIVSLCRESGIYLIEDVAHAPDARYKGRACGTFGDYGCFSFFTNKNLSIGEGGMIISRDRKLADKAKYIRSHGMTALTFDRHRGRTISYDVITSGLNYRIDEIRSAIGIVQLKKLKKGNQKRELIVKRYMDKLSDIDEISIPFQNIDNMQPAYHIFPILLSPKIDREWFIYRLKEVGIQSSIHYPIFRKFTAFKDMGLNSAPIAEEIAVRELTLPLYPTMSFDEVDFVCENIYRILEMERML
jgi:dTDP-4-amino-4,6-dideoxygalactose transaminase